MTTVGPELILVADAAAVARAAAGEIARSFADAITARGVAHWATTGGSSAPPIYGALRVPPLSGTVDWAHVQVWWGDDRFVSRADPVSNVQPLAQGLLRPDGIGLLVPSTNIHPVPVDEALASGADAAWAAAAYADELRAAGPPPDEAGVPVFDLVLVGVGPDGHILSVFPGSPVWDDPGLCADVPAPTHVGPHVDRITLHPRVLASARRVLVVTSGASKAAMLARAWTGDDVRELPVRAARLPSATWILDVAAAAGLSRR